MIIFMSVIMQVLMIDFLSFFNFNQIQFTSFIKKIPRTKTKTPKEPETNCKNA